jgi:hypothetical protein
MGRCYKGGVDEISEFLVSSQQLIGEQLAFIELRLRYLIESAGRLGRKDWKNVALSVLVSIVLYPALPGPVAGEMFRLAAVLFRTILKGTHLLP